MDSTGLETKQEKRTMFAELWDLDMEVKNLTLATMNHSKDRWEQRAVIKLKEAPGWQVEEISQRKHSAWAGRKGEISNMKNFNDWGNFCSREGIYIVRCLAASLASAIGASTTPAPEVTTKIISRYGQMSPKGRGQIAPGWEPLALPGLGQVSGSNQESLVLDSVVPS